MNYSEEFCEKAILILESLDKNENAETIHAILNQPTDIIGVSFDETSSRRDGSHEPMVNLLTADSKIKAQQFAGMPARIVWRDTKEYECVDVDVMISKEEAHHTILWDHPIIHRVSLFWAMRDL